MTEKKSPKPEQVTMSVVVPQGGVAIKLHNHTRCMGTIIITKNGVGFAKPKQKKGVDRTIPWSIMSKLMEVGIA